MGKNEARRIIIHKLKKVPSRSRRLYQQLFELPQWCWAHVIAVTISTPIELDTRPIIRRAWQDDKETVVPKIFPNQKMEFVKYSTKTHLCSNRYGILEPINSPMVCKKQIDLMIIPGVCFALKTRDRLGFGGGYYDRYLKGCSAYKVALARSAQWVYRSFWPVENNDVKMDLILH